MSPVWASPAPHTWTAASAALGLAVLLLASACQATPEQVAAAADLQGLEQIPDDDGLSRLRECESNSRYTVVSRNGRFHGAYQFTIGTWNGVAARWFPWLVGVSPEKAAPYEQDAMARALWKERGAQPWPHCGRLV